MKVLKTLKLKNFCSYDHLEIELGPLTCIRGPNGSGKSNIILALVTVLFNLDFVAGYIRNGQKEASVEIEFTDGSSIYRWRDKTKQQIILTEANGKKTEFKTTKCTDEVQEFTGFKQVQLDRNASAEFLQYIPPKSSQFLLDKSPEVTMRMLSALISGQGVELVKTDLQTEVRAEQAKEKTITELSDTTQANIAYLTSPIVTELTAQADALQEEFKAIDELERTIQSLVGYRVTLKTALTDEDETYLADLFVRVDANAEALFMLNELEVMIRDAEKSGEDLCGLLDDTEKQTRLVAQLDKELQSSLKELQHYKCAKCGKIVKEICKN